jgi:hypothetical protein
MSKVGGLKRAFAHDMQLIAVYAERDAVSR